MENLSKFESNWQLFEQEVFNAYVKSLRNSLMKVVQDKCYGCQINHPSQKQHEICLFWTFDEQVDCFLEDALMRVDEAQVIEDCVKALQTYYPGDDLYSKLSECCNWEKFDVQDEKGLMRLKKVIKEHEKKRYHCNTLSKEAHA